MAMPKKKIVAKKKLVASKKKAPSAKKKSPVKKKPAKKIKAKAPAAWSDFSQWWDKVAQKKVDKIERAWISVNEPNDPEEDAGGDHWHVNEMMHSGGAHETTAEIAEEIFEKGRKGEAWQMSQCESLYCELDSVIDEAYEAGRKARK
jgi:hypothetical protein